MDLLRLAGLAMLEGYGLQRALPEYHFRTAFLAAFLLNLLLNALYSFAIYPFLVNPLRHLPTVKVFPPCITPGHRHGNHHASPDSGQLIDTIAMIGRPHAA